jgi:ribosome-associated protein
MHNAGVSRLPPEIVITNRVRVPAAELGVSTARSGGPGGQHVNKTESKVVLRWSVAGSRALAEHDRAWLLSRLASRLTSDGELVLDADGERSQSANLDAVLRRFAQLVREALIRPKTRRATRPTRASKTRRLDGKRRRGDLKRDRRAGE